MAIDETNTLTLWNNVSAWSIYLVIKIAGIIAMMLWVSIKRCVL